MPRRTPGGEDAARRAEEGVRALEAGGIPPAAQQRLAALRRGGSSFFTSDLTTPEFLLARGSGFRPLTQVMGSCFYNVGWQWMPAGASWGAQWQAGGGAGRTVELETPTEAWNEARRLALGRLREEARQAGADAVVGVRLQRGAYDWAAGLIEFVAVGTAVVSERYDLGGEPVLSNLSGQEFAKLFRHGYWPAGLVGATTVCYVLTGWQQQSRASGLFSGMQNQELGDFTQGLYDARSQAMLHLTRQAHELEAHGVVGLRLEHAQHPHERSGGGFTDLIVTVHVLGTAIAELAAQPGEQPVYIALPLDQEAQ